MSQKHARKGTQRNRIYVGVRNGTREVFKSAIRPSTRTHGRQFAAVIGPFHTMRAAQLMAVAGGNNPHLQTVADAERIAAKEKRAHDPLVAKMAGELGRAGFTASIVAKLEPIKTSGQFRAILGCLLHQKWTDPQIAELVITSDSMLLARAEGDIGANDFIGAASDLFNNLRGIAKAAALTDNETQHLINLAEACRI